MKWLLSANCQRAATSPTSGRPEGTASSTVSPKSCSRPVVAVTQGTLANRDLSELIEPALAGLAGMDVTQQAIAAGVPVIVAGVTEDKPAVAARAAYHGLGIDLQTATPAPEAVTAAVESVLQDDGMRENVRQFAQVYAAHDPLTEIGRLTLA
ncbi:MAG TPA: hypothetical protein VGG75_23510 [Trebonia sp.]|jgi:UDP:flavonoid glycosyltransferase YjiC (YdhE family)